MRFFVTASLPPWGKGNENCKSSHVKVIKE